MVPMPTNHPPPKNRSSALRRKEGSRVAQSVSPAIPQSVCIEYNAQIVIGKENYFLSAEGLLMPAKKGRTPPDLRYFDQSQK
jgi:hypothetical protein